MPPSPSVQPDALLTKAKKPTKIVISEDKDMDFILGLIAEIHNEFTKDDILLKGKNVEVVMPNINETLTTPLTDLSEIITKRRLYDIGRIDIKFGDVQICVTGNPYDTMKAQGFEFPIVENKPHTNNPDYFPFKSLFEANNLQYDILEELKRIQPNFSNLEQDIKDGWSIRFHYNLNDEQELPEKLKKGMAYLKEYYERSKITSEFTEKNLPTPELIEVIRHLSGSNNKTKYLPLKERCSTIEMACSENLQLFMSTLFNEKEAPAISILDNNVNPHFYFSGLLPRNEELMTTHIATNYRSPILCASSTGDKFMHKENIGILKLLLDNKEPTFDHIHVAFERISEKNPKPVAKTWQKVKEVLGLDQRQAVITN